MRFRMRVLYIAHPLILRIDFSLLIIKVSALHHVVPIVKTGEETRNCAVGSADESRK